MAMTADPARNDISEIQSQLNKLYPDGRYGDEQVWHKRYGLNTTASRDALQREVASRFFTQEITPPVNGGNRRDVGCARCAAGCIRNYRNQRPYPSPGRSIGPDTWGGT
jgi:hypothetical protein